MRSERHFIRVVKLYSKPLCLLSLKRGGGGVCQELEPLLLFVNSLSTRGKTEKSSTNIKNWHFIMLNIFKIYCRDRRFLVLNG